MVVMLMSGSIMKWYSPFSDSWRQGATFVHDWFAIGLLFAIIGHIALGVPRSRRAQRHGARLGEAGVGEAPPPPLVRGDRRVQPTGAARRDRGRRRSSHAFAQHAAEVGLGAGEVAVVDPVDGGAGDGVGEREL